MCELCLNGKNKINSISGLNITSPYATYDLGRIEKVFYCPICGRKLSGVSEDDCLCELKTANDNRCNLASCRYNRNGICQNEGKRKECVDVSKLVLCLEDREDEWNSKTV